MKEDDDALGRAIRKVSEEPDIPEDIRAWLRAFIEGDEPEEEEGGR